MFLQPTLRLLYERNNLCLELLQDWLRQITIAASAREARKVTILKLHLAVEIRIYAFALRADLCPAILAPDLAHAILHNDRRLAACRLVAIILDAISPDANRLIAIRLCKRVVTVGASDADKHRVTHRASTLLWVGLNAGAHCLYLNPVGFCWHCIRCCYCLPSKPEFVLVLHNVFERHLFVVGAVQCREDEATTVEVVVKVAILLDAKLQAQLLAGKVRPLALVDGDLEVVVSGLAVTRSVKDKEVREVEHHQRLVEEVGNRHENVRVRRHPPLMNWLGPENGARKVAHRVVVGLFCTLSTVTFLGNV